MGQSVRRINKVTSHTINYCAFMLKRQIFHRILIDQMENLDGLPIIKENRHINVTVRHFLADTALQCNMSIGVHLMEQRNQMIILLIKRRLSDTLFNV